MVGRVLQGVYKEVRGVHQAAYILAIFTFGSQILALIRDRLLAHQFGAGIELDLYYAAFRVPDLLYVVFASMLSVYVIIPFIAHYTESGALDRARTLLSQVFTIFLGAYVCMALVVIIFAPQIVAYFFPGFSAQSSTLVLLMRVLLLQPLLLGISSLFGVITQMQHRFILYAISPLLYNLGIIAGLVWIYPQVGIVGLAVGVVLGALLHLLVQIPFIKKTGLAPTLVSTFDWSQIAALCRLSFTRALTLSLHQIILFGFIGFASIMSIGSVSVFQFAFNLQSVPLAIIGVSYSVAAFPLLAQLYAERRFSEFGSQIAGTLRHILFWSVPTIVFFIVIRAQFVRVVLGSGAFDWDDTRLTAAVLAILILSLTAQAVNLLLVRALYAVGNTRIPFYITLASSWLALFVALLAYLFIVAHEAVRTELMNLMRLDGVAGVEVLALPIGYSIALLLHTFIMLIVSRRHIFLSVRSLLSPAFQAVIAAGVGGATAYGLLNYFVAHWKNETFLTIFLQGTFAFVGGSFVYVLIQYAFRNRELAEIYESLRKKFRKDDIVIPQDEDTLSV